MHFRLSVTGLALVGLCAAGLAAWPVGSAETGKPRIVHIVVQDGSFVIKPEDQDITVKPGEEIQWLDKFTLPSGGQAAHELGPAAGEDPFPGTTEFRHDMTTKFTTPGVIEYDCKRHGSMTGKITVTEATPSKK